MFTPHPAFELALTSQLSWTAVPLWWRTDGMVQPELVCRVALLGETSLTPSRISISPTLGHGSPKLSKGMAISDLKTKAGYNHSSRPNSGPSATTLRHVSNIEHHGSSFIRGSGLQSYGRPSRARGIENIPRVCAQNEGVAGAVGQVLVAGSGSVNVVTAIELGEFLNSTRDREGRRTLGRGWDPECS